MNIFQEIFFMSILRIRKQKKFSQKNDWKNWSLIFQIFLMIKLLIMKRRIQNLIDIWNMYDQEINGMKFIDINENEIITDSFIKN